MLFAGMEGAFRNFATAASRAVNSARHHAEDATEAPTMIS